MIRPRLGTIDRKTHVRFILFFASNAGAIEPTTAAVTAQ